MLNNINVSNTCVTMDRLHHDSTKIHHNNGNGLNIWKYKYIREKLYETLRSE